MVTFLLFELTFPFFSATLSIIFLVRGIKSRKPKKSVKKPGIISNNAAIAIDAPDNISLRAFYSDKGLPCRI